MTQVELLTERYLGESECCYEQMTTGDRVVKPGEKACSETVSDGLASCELATNSVFQLYFIFCYNIP